MLRRAFSRTPARAVAGSLGLLLLASACARGDAIEEAALTPRNESSKIFAADGTLITTLRQEENRELIAIEAIPNQVRNAVVAIEDSRFFNHKGFDAKAMLRALVANARSGRVVEGGSTITQQLVRNALKEVGREQTLERKIKEANFAYRVEETFSKTKILELYLNTVYFGEGAYGVQTAARTYFGKDIKDVNLAEAALLAGMIKAPVTYDPYVNAKGATERRNQVLDRMYEQGLADAKAIAEAKGADLGVQKKSEEIRYAAPYFVDLVTRLIQRSEEFAELGESVAERGNRLFRGGLRVHTTIDMKMQAAAEEAIGKVLDHPDDPSAALAAVDPKTGHIKALVGGRDFFAEQEADPCIRLGAVNDDGSPKTCAKVNLALGRAGGGSGRQSGSSFKPFALAAALAEGKKLSDTYSAPSCIEIPKADAGRTWRVCNYEESSFGGSMSLRDGTVKSVNTVYAQLVMDVGASDVMKTAEKMGVGATARAMGLDPGLSAVPSAALGTNAVSPLDMASAFAPFATLGIQPGAQAITRITDSRGQVLWSAVDDQAQAINPGVAYLTNQALQEVIERGTAARFGRIGRPAFGKTGTAQEWRDAWFVGGAGTDLVAAVAVFWPDGEIEMKPSCGGRRKDYVVRNGDAIPPECRPTRIRVAGGTWPTQIWQVFMLKALDGMPATKFPVPKVDVVKVSVDITRGCKPNPYTPEDLIRTQSYIKGTEPTEICKEPAGPSQSGIPAVTGFPEAAAVKLLERAGYVAEVKQEPSFELPPGYVVRQSPDAGAGGDARSKVTIWVSVAAQTRAVPDVVNFSLQEARSVLEGEGFKVKVDAPPSCSGEKEKCFVWDQSPDGGGKVAKGGEVTISAKRRP